MYTRAERNHFMKKAMFARYPVATLTALGHVSLDNSREHGVLVYGPERDQGLHGWQRVIFLPL